MTEGETAAVPPSTPAQEEPDVAKTADDTPADAPATSAAEATPAAAEAVQSCVNAILSFDVGADKLVCCIAMKGATPHVVANELNQLSTPSLVSFKDNIRYIGEHAVPHVVSTPQTTVVCVKNFLGRPYSEEIAAQSMVPIVAHPSGKLAFEVSHADSTRVLLPEQVLAMQLKAMTAQALAYAPQMGAVLSTPPTTFVALPCSFTTEQVASTIDAFRIAGLRVAGVVNEVTAIGLAHAVKHPIPEGSVLTAMFIDIGHSIISAGIAKLTKDKFTLCHSASRDNVGGASFDLALFDECATRFQEKTKLDVRKNKRANLKLMQACEKTKRVLSTIPESKVEVECLLEDHNLQQPMTREQLLAITRGIQTSVTDFLSKLVEDSGMTIDQIDLVEVVGGTTRMPSVQACIEAFFKKPLSKMIDSSASVALGAGVYGLMDASVFGGLNKYACEDATSAKLSSYASATSDSDIQAFAEVEAELQRCDDAAAALHNMRNEIEAVLVRTNEDYEEAMQKKAVAAEPDLETVLRSAREWLYDHEDGVSIEELTTRLEGLKAEIAGACPALVEFVKAREEAKEKARQEEAAKPITSAPSSSGRQPRSTKERIQFAEKRKEQGNSLFKEGDFAGAIARYAAGLQFMSEISNSEMTDEVKAQMKPLQASMHLNSSMCALKMKDNKKAVEFAQKALEVDSTNVKALFRLAQGYSGLQEYGKAKAHLLEAQKIDADNKEVAKELALVERNIQRQTDKEKKMFSKMFG